MKRFLSLVLTLVMVMSLVTVSAGAKDFTDNDTIAYDEAVAVVSEVGIVDGYADGDFKPTNTLTRQAAAKIICNLKLGPTTAAELHADTAPYKDVPANNEFAGYIAYCQKLGIISGYADGNFRPGNPLTGYAFMKMLLGALGYDASLEGYVGANWSINVAKQALGIGLDDGLETKEDAVFNGIKPVTREEACLYAFNTLQADMVEYGQRLTTNINGTEVTLSSGGATSRNWNSQQSRNENIRKDNIIQFAEEYFNKLVKKDSTDKFYRPANTWLYDKIEIGTWTDYTLLVERYTKAISGKDVYDLLGATAIKDNTLLAYVDGQDSGVTKTDLVRTNKDDLTKTGNGVLTEIFLDTDTEELSIISVHTYLAQATDNYVEAKEYAPLQVWGDFDYNEKTANTYKTWNVDAEDVKNVVDVKDEEFYLVNISYKDLDVAGEVVMLRDVEIMEDSTVTKFSAGKDGDGTNRVKKLTTGGTEYKNNYQAWYDEDILDQYDQQLLTDASYNIYLDQYGYFIGVDLFEGTKNYVFITGFDRGRSNISVKTADAAGIFLDGTMSTIKVNVTDTDKNIERLYTNKAGYDAQTVDADYAGTNAIYFKKWNDTTRLSADHNGAGGYYNLNQWYTYTENNGTYTLRPCARMTATVWNDSTSTAVGAEVVLRTDRLNVQENRFNTPADSFDGNNARVYGEDDTTFITVEMDDVDTTSGNKQAITDVSGVYTGVQNVELEIDTKTTEARTQGQVYTVYDKNYYVIGAIVVGEARGAEGNYAYILSKAKSEEKIDDTYYWEFDAILGGEIKTLTAKSKYHNTIDQLVKGSLKELRFDGDYVINIKDVTDIYSDTRKNIDGEDFYDIDSSAAIFDNNYLPSGIIATTGDDNMLVLSLQGRTLYVTANQSDMGLALSGDCKAVVIQDENNESGVKTEFTSVRSAIARLAEPAGEQNTAGTQYQGRIVAALNSDGVAQWIVFVNDNTLYTGSNAGGGGGGGSTLPTYSDLPVSLNTGSVGNARYVNGKLYLEFQGLPTGATKVKVTGLTVFENGSGRVNYLPDVTVTKPAAQTYSNVETFTYSAQSTATALTITGSVTALEVPVSFVGAPANVSGPATVAAGATTMDGITVTKPAGATEWSLTWTATTAVPNTATVQYSVDNGSTWSAMTAGTAVTGLTAASAKVKITAGMVAASAAANPSVNLTGVASKWALSLDTTAITLGTGVVVAISKSGNPVEVAAGGTAAPNVTVHLNEVTGDTKHRVSVEYTVNGTAKTATATLAATDVTKDVALAVAATEAVEEVRIVVNSVKLQAQVTVTETTFDAATTTQLTDDATATYNGKNKAGIEADWLDVGSTVSVKVTVPGVSGNGVKVTIDGTDTNVTTGTDVEVTGTYTVKATANALTVVAANIV